MKTTEKSGSTGAQPISLKDLWQVFLKRKWIVAGTAAVILVVVTAISLLTPPTYTARGQLLIEREPNILSFENMFQIEPLSDDYYQTQYKLLQSRALAGDTIDRIKLVENKAFLDRFFQGGSKPGVDPKADPLLRRRLVNWFLERVSVQPLRRTRLVDVRFGHRDPQLAADILNAMIESYIEMNVARKYEATEQATDFLATEIENVRNGIREKETKLQEYGRSKDILTPSASENTTLATLAEINSGMTAAKIERINKQSYYNAIKDAGPDYIPSALNSPALSSLAEEYNRLSRDYAKSSEIFLPDMPQLQQLKAQLDDAKKALESETRNLVNRAYTEWQAAASREQGLTNELNRVKSAAFQMNSNAIQYSQLLIEIQNDKNLLETLMTRMSEADVSSRLKGFRTSNIWVVDDAEVPLSPSSPNTKKNMVLGLLVGLFIGLGLALLYESLDVTVKDAEDVRKYAGVPTLGLIPMFSKDGKEAEAVQEAAAALGDMANVVWTSIGKKRPDRRERRDEAMDLVVQFAPESAFAEQYRSVRTSLLFSMDDMNRRALAVTSPLPQDGKTATACNLAASLAQAGKRVVVVDADLRKPRLHRVFRTKNLNGLAKYLMAGLALDDLVRATAIPGLFLVNAGPQASDPLELLGSDKLATLFAQLKKDFDFVLVDTPPALAVSDALVVGSRLDGAIMVVRRGQTPREALRRAQEKLDAYKIKTLGVVINAVRMRDLDEYHVSSYYGREKRTGG